MMSRKSRRRIGDILAYAALFIIVVLFLFPVYYLVTTSLKPQAEAFSSPPVWISFTPILDNYKAVLTSSNFTKGLINSVIIAGVSSLVATFLGSLAAYALSRYNFKGKNDMSFFILSIRMFPPIVAVVPYFMMARFFRLLDSHFLLIIVYLTFTTSFAAWVMKGFFDAIPKELDESGMVDGLTPFQVFFKLILPTAKAGFFAVLTINLITTWNEYLFALILTGRKAFTLPTVANSYIKAMGVAWGEMMAAGVLIALPMVIFGFLIRNYLITGLSLGAHTQK